METNVKANPRTVQKQGNGGRPPKKQASSGMMDSSMSLKSRTSSISINSRASASWPPFSSSKPPIRMRQSIELAEVIQKKPVDKVVKKKEAKVEASGSQLITTQERTHIPRLNMGVVQGQQPEMHHDYKEVLEHARRQQEKEKHQRKRTPLRPSKSAVSLPSLPSYSNLYLGIAAKRLFR